MDGGVKIWEPASGNEVSSFQGVVNDAVYLAFDPRSQILAVGQSNAQKRGLPSEVRLYAARSCKLLAVLPHTDQVVGMVFSPDGRRLFTSQWASSTVHVWDVGTAKDPQPPSGHFDDVLTVAFSPVDCQIVTGGLDRTMRFWDANDGKERIRVDGFRRGVASVAVSPDGRSVLADERFTRWSADDDADGDHGLRLWDLTDGTVIRRFEGNAYGSRALSFSPDCKSVISADSALSLWDVGSGKIVREFEGYAGTTAIHASHSRRKGRASLPLVTTVSSECGTCPAVASCSDSQDRQGPSGASLSVPTAAGSSCLEPTVMSTSGNWPPPTHSRRTFSRMGAPVCVRFPRMANCWPRPSWRAE
jgi:WD40 repeat protein